MKEQTDKKEQAEQTIIELRAGLDQLDQITVENEVPDLTFFLQHVQKTKSENRRKLIRDLSIFWGIAFAILSLWTATFFHSPMIFLGIQVVATVALPIIGYVFSSKRTGESL